MVRGGVDDPPGSETGLPARVQLNGHEDIRRPCSPRGNPLPQSRAAASLPDGIGRAAADQLLPSERSVSQAV